MTVALDKALFSAVHRFINFTSSIFNIDKIPLIISLIECNFVFIYVCMYILAA